MITTQNLLTNRIKPAVKWPGGKSRHLPMLLPLIQPHNCYVEVFAGGLALLLAKQRSKVEVINDLSADLVGFYRVVKFHLDALLDEIVYVLNSRREFYDLLEQPGFTDVQRAARFLLRQKLSYSAAGHSFACHGARSSRRYQMELIEALNERLDRVIIENLPWQRCVNIYDGAGTFFFFDPPYIVSKVGVYAAWTVKEMEEFGERLKTIKGGWVVTVDDSPHCRRIFRAFHQRKITTRNLMINQRRQGSLVRFGELIVTPCRTQRVTNKPVVMKPDTKLFGKN